MLVLEKFGKIYIGLFGKLKERFVKIAMLVHRKATVNDAGAIAVVVNSSYRGKGGWTSEINLIEGTRITPSEAVHFIDSNKANQNSILVFELEGEIIGTVCLEQQSPCTISLGMFSVAPQLQDKGYGKSILALAEGFVKQTWTEASEIELTVISQRIELIQWYLRRGYKDTSEKIPFPYENKSVGHPLRPDLTFSILRKPL